MSGTRFLILRDKTWPEGDKVTLVWKSTMNHQCRVLMRAIPVKTLEEIADLDDYFQIYDLLGRKRLIFSGTRGEAVLEDGWTIGEDVNALTTPSNWSPPDTPIGRLYAAKDRG